MGFVLNPYRYAGGVTLLHDTFTDADSTLLTNHTPDIDVEGGGWIAETNNFSIVSNALDSDDTIRSVYIDVGQANHTLTAKLQLGSTIANRYIIFGVRWTDNNNRFGIVIQRNTSPAATFKIQEADGGVFNDRDSTSVTITPGVEYSVTVICSGTNISAQIDGGNDISYSSSLHQSVTNVAVRARADGYIDDLLVVT